MTIPTQITALARLRRFEIATDREPQGRCTFDRQEINHYKPNFETSTTFGENDERKD